MRGASSRDLFRHSLSRACSLMERVDKAGRVQSYIQAQFPFVPFYGTDLLGPGGSQSEPFGLQTPMLTARNPLVSSQPISNPSYVPVCLEVQGSRGGSTDKNSRLTEKLAENRKNRLKKRLPSAIEPNISSSTSKKGIRIASGPDTPRKPTKDLSPLKRKRKGHREKPRLPTGLSLLYGFAPKNIGPSRLTVSRSKPYMSLEAYNHQIPAGDKGFFGKGKSSSTAPAIFLLNQTGGRSLFWRFHSHLPLYFKCNPRSTNPLVLRTNSPHLTPQGMLQKMRRHSQNKPKQEPTTTR
jgi:hypothetical protein